MTTWLLWLFAAAVVGFSIWLWQRARSNRFDFEDNDWWQGPL